MKGIYFNDLERIGLYKWAKIPILEAIIQPMIPYLQDDYEEVLKLKQQKLEGEKRLFNLVCDSEKYHLEKQTLIRFFSQISATPPKEAENDTESPFARLQILRRLYMQLAALLALDPSGKLPPLDSIDALYLKAELKKLALKNTKKDLEADEQKFVRILDAFPTLPELLAAINSKQRLKFFKDSTYSMMFRSLLNQADPTFVNENLEKINSILEG